MNILDLIQQKFRAAFSGLGVDVEKYVAMVKPVQNVQHGDYQANCAMALAKELGKKPREVAEEIKGRLPLGDELEPPEVAGPGFINLRLRKDWIAARLQEMARDDRLGVRAAAKPQTYVIDYSSPNVAKPLHVGHLRSTIIGDALARLLRFLGHRVIADNHLGDWGLQFGMLLYGYKHHRDEAALAADPVQEMVRLYVKVRGLIDPAEQVEDAAKKAEDYPAEVLARARQVHAACRQETSKLHAGDPENFALWQKFMPWCLGAIEPIYQRLDVKFDHTHGESFYNPMLQDVVDSLLYKGIAWESKGAVVVFFNDKGEVADGPEEEVDPEAEGPKKNKIPPAVIRSGHGAFTYTTSDLATVRYRMEEWSPDAMLYVVDFRQALHFKNLFAIARRWKYAGVHLEHVSFGSVLGTDGRPLQTRSGGGTELSALLDEAVRRGGQAYDESCAERRERGQEIPELTAEERCEIAETVGLGAVKYADLCQNRTTDYKFSWDKMLATNGNTATYMQYGYARTRAIFRKGDENPQRFRHEPPLPSLDEAEERALGVKLLQLEESLQPAAADLQPHVITSYLWELSKSFAGFYQKHKVLEAETPALRDSRLLLCDLTGRVIQLALSLVGIRTVERM